MYTLQYAVYICRFNHHTAKMKLKTAQLQPVVNIMSTETFKFSFEYQEDTLT